MLSKTRLLIAAPLLAAGLMAIPTDANADWRHRHGGFHRHHHHHGGFHHHHRHRGPGAGAIVGGALLGLGAGALIGGALAAPPAYYAPPPAYYAPPPAYYPPPAYAPAYYPPAYPRW